MIIQTTIFSVDKLECCGYQAVKYLDDIIWPHFSRFDIQFPSVKRPDGRRKPSFRQNCCFAENNLHWNECHSKEPALPAARSSVREQNITERMLPDVRYRLVKKTKCWCYLEQQTSSTLPVQLSVQFLQRPLSFHRVPDAWPESCSTRRVSVLRVRLF